MIFLRKVTISSSPPFKTFTNLSWTSFGLFKILQINAKIQIFFFTVTRLDSTGLEKKFSHFFIVVKRLGAPFVGLVSFLSAVVHAPRTGPMHSCLIFFFLHLLSVRKKKNNWWFLLGHSYSDYSCIVLLYRWPSDIGSWETYSHHVLSTPFLFLEKEKVKKAIY